MQPPQPPLQFGVLKRWWPFVILVLILIAGLGVYIDWTWKRKLSPRGGRYFFHRVELAVPSFRQSDEKWSDDSLGGIEANGTLGGEGCAVAAAAMVFKFYGVETDPQQLNWFLHRLTDTPSKAGFIGIAQRGSRPTESGTCTKTWPRIS